MQGPLVVEMQTPGEGSLEETTKCLDALSMKLLNVQVGETGWTEEALGVQTHQDVI